MNGDCLTTLSLREKRTGKTFLYLVQKIQFSCHVNVPFETHFKKVVVSGPQNSN